MGMKKVSITNYINKNYRTYAIYTLENRGIPCFYDSLTNVQRLILLNTPNRTTKTLTVVGECIKDGYHHSNMSLENAINRLARPFNNSEQLLIGDGFFGTQINSDAASARYTSVYINPVIESYLKKYKYLNKKDKEGNYLNLNIDFPLGLLLPIIGIAVGYRTMILPRNRKHIEDYLANKRLSLPPYFKGFKGTINKYKDLDNAWIIEGKYEVSEQHRLIHITSIPPLMKYKSFIKKVDKYIGENDVQIINSSKDEIKIAIKFPKKIAKEEWELFRDKVIKATKLIVRENIIFVKDGKVLEYEKVEDYLSDFKTKNEYLKVDSLRYYVNVFLNELDYLKAKLKFLTWMNRVKANNQKIKEIDVQKFLNQFSINIQSKLDNIKLRKLNEDEVNLTKQSIKKYEELIDTTKKNLQNQQKYLKTLSNKLNIKNKNTVVLFDEELNEIDDIEIFYPDEEKVV